MLTQVVRAPDTNGGRVDHLWSGNLPLLADSKFAADGLPQRAKVPYTHEALSEWAFVKKHYSPDPRRRYVFVYTPESPMQVIPEPVILRFQGFISGCDLNAIGNWTKYVL